MNRTTAMISAAAAFLVGVGLVIGVNALTHTPDAATQTPTTAATTAPAATTTTSPRPPPKKKNNINIYKTPSTRYITKPLVFPLPQE